MDIKKLIKPAVIAVLAAAIRVIFHPVRWNGVETPAYLPLNPAGGAATLPAR
jgi:hypothetical protein